MDVLDQYLEDPSATERFGARLAECCAGGSVIYLHGQLGAGKTTLVRGFLRALGFTGPVKSPTYTLLESYPIQYGVIHHLDLYRLSDPEELEWIGIRDLFDDASVCMIDWPEQGIGVLPDADLRISLRVEGTGRQVSMESGSARGEQILRCHR
jgi:tRNA threonylcarbamoyladenosine biosynthesis protein TsaE